MEWKETEKPNDYYLYPGTKRLGEKLKVWQVQTKKFPEIDPGLVSSRDRFINTPDAEIISGGVNGKGPHSVAVGRHGNFLLWGFYAQPKHMTESAQNAFVNAVCYIKQFDGSQASAVLGQRVVRETLLGQVYFLRSVSDEYLDEMVKEYQERIKETPPTEEMLKEIGDDPKAHFREMYGDYAKRILDELPGDVRKACDDDVNRLVAYYDANLEFLRRDAAGKYHVDKDVQKLGISNREVAFVKKCISMLESEEQSALALRLLDRYVGATNDDPEEWRRWWRDHADKVRYDSNTEKFVASDQ